jgi:adenosylcobyric acid synthase
MLGTAIEDPDGVESSIGRMDGIGLLPVRTVLRSPKVTRVVAASITPSKTSEAEFAAYEIHMGHTKAMAPVEPFARLADGSPEGARVRNVTGTYLHGIFEHPEVVRQTLGIDLPPILDKSEMYDRLAGWLTAHSEPRVLEDLLA